MERLAKVAVSAPLHSSAVLETARLLKRGQGLLPSLGDPPLSTHDEQRRSDGHAQYGISARVVQ